MALASEIERWWKYISLESEHQMRSVGYASHGLNPIPHAVRLKAVPAERLYAADAWARDHGGVFGQSWARHTTYDYPNQSGLAHGLMTLSATFAFDDADTAFEFKLRFG